MITEEMCDVMCEYVTQWGGINSVLIEAKYIFIAF